MVCRLPTISESENQGTIQKLCGSGKGKDRLTSPPLHIMDDNDMSGDGAAALLDARKRAVRSSWKAVDESLGVGATELFYKRLFEKYPEVRPMFPQGDFDMNEQAEKLFNTVSLAVDYLDDVPSLLPILEKLGAKVRPFVAVASDLAWRC